MNTRNIALWAVVIVVVAGGIFLVTKYSGLMGSTPSATNDAAGNPQNQQTASTTDTVQGQDVTVGTGTQAVPGSVVSLLYVGALEDGTVFDSSAAHDNKPLEFTLGDQGLIPGFQIGVNGMKVGGERRILIPPTLGYGSQEIKDPSGKVIIPANSKLLFDLKLVKVSAAPPATTK